MRTLGRVLWASPTSALGVMLLVAGAWRLRLRVVDGVIEAHGPALAWILTNLVPVSSGASALTLGHVVVGRDAWSLDETRLHERVHVRQCESWGPLFIPAYLAGSLIAAWRGGHYYYDNPFEREAYQVGRVQPGPSSAPDRRSLFHRVPVTIERRIAVGFAASATLLTVTVWLLIRFAGSYTASVLTLLTGLALLLLLGAWYLRTLSDLGQQQELVHRLQQDNADLHALHRLTAALQASRSRPALNEAVLDFSRVAFPDDAGAVFARSGQTELKVLVTWGTRFGAVDRTGACYALRDAQTFSSPGADTGYRCPHVESGYVGPYVCVPIKAGVGTAGVFHLRHAAAADASDAQRRQSLSEAAASRIGIGLEALELHGLLQTQSQVDPLTGLCNRRALFEHASRVHARAIGSGSVYSVILADIDRFKALNDTLGHAAGDTILVTFARHVQRHIRSEDIACRHGGEEFVILLPDAPRDVAVQRAEAIRSPLGSLRTTVPASAWRLSASFGVATFPADGNSFVEILQRADEAMYEAKLAGRDRVASWSHASRRA